MSIKLVELAADIVASQASANPMSIEEVQEAICKVYNCLFHVNQSEEAGTKCCCECEGDEAPKAEAPKPATAIAPSIDPSNSIQADRVVCLECGESFAVLTGNHLKSHGLTSRTYKQKHGMKLGTTLMATNVSAKRSKAAKEAGRGQGLKAWREKTRKL